jgi:hypothetical protein
MRLLLHWSVSGSVLILLTMGTACSLERNVSKARIEIAEQAPSLEPRQKTRSSGPPSSIAGFDCFAVNVIGEKVAATGNAPQRASLSAITAGSHCTYPGRVSALIPSTGGTVEVFVPNGQTVVQVLGIISPGGCSVSDSVRTHFDKAPSTVSDPTFPGIYEVGRTTLTVSGSTSISVSSNYTSSNAKEVRCYQDSMCGTGAGTSVDPFTVCTAAHLAAIATNPAWHYRLGQNINLSGTSISPIGLGTTFTGEFDGQGFTLSNYSYSGVDSYPIGVFSSVGSSMRIENLNVDFPSIAPTGAQTAVGGLIGQMGGGTVENVTINQGNVAGPNLAYTGGLIGHLTSGTVSTVTVTGTTVSGNGNTGGLLGYVSTSAPTISVASALSTASVTSTNGDSVGGLVGYLFTGSVASASITQSAARGTITATGTGAIAGIGGAIGVIDSSGGTISVSKTSSIGNVTATGGSNNADKVGGFVGYVNRSGGSITLSDTYSQGAVSANGNDIGGFCGRVTGLGSLTFQNSYASTETVSAVTAMNSSGFFGNISGASISTSELYSNDVVSLVGGGSRETAGTTLELKSAGTFLGFDFVTVWDISTSFPFLRGAP